MLSAQYSHSSQGSCFTHWRSTSASCVACIWRDIDWFLVGTGNALQSGTPRCDFLAELMWGRQRATSFPGSFISRQAGRWKSLRTRLDKECLGSIVPTRPPLPWILTRHRGNTYLTSLQLVSVHRHCNVNSVNVDCEISPRVQALFSLCTIYVVSNEFN